MASAVKAGEAYVELLARTTKFEKSLRRAQRRLRAFGQGMISIGTKIAASGVALAAPFLIATKIFASFGDTLDKMAQRTNFSVEALSALKFAAEQTGTNLQSVEKAAQKLAASIFDLGLGLSTQVDAFKELGIAFKDIKDLSPEKQFLKISAAISQIENDTTRAAVAQRVFGRAGKTLLPLFQQGAKGIEALVKEASELGLIISTDQAKAAADFTDEMNRLASVLRVGLFRIGLAIAPILDDVSRRLRDVAKNASDWVLINKPLIRGIFKLAIGIAAAGTALIALGSAFLVAAFGVGIFASIIAATVTILAGIPAVLSLLFSPIALVTALVVGLGVAAVTHFGLMGKAIETLKSRFGSLLGVAKTTFEGIKAAISNGDIEGAMDILGAGLLVALQTFLGQMTVSWAMFRRDVVNIMTSAGETVLNVWANVFGALDIALSHFISFFKQVFAGAIQFIRTQMETLGAGIARLGALLDKAFSPRSFNLTKALDDINELERKNKAIIDEQAKASILDASQGPAAARQKRDETLKEIKDLAESIRQGEDDNVENAVKESTKKLEILNRQLDELVTAAKNAPQPKDLAARGYPRKKSDKVKLDSVPELANFSGFNPFKFERRTSEVDVAMQQLKVQKRMAKDTNIIKKEMQKGGKFA